MTDTNDDLAPLRRKVGLRMVQIDSALVGRPTPWRDWQSIARQLATMGFRSVDHPEQTAHELATMLVFLDSWRELLAITENITWPDPHDDEQ